ncbi:MAG: hypothetical protein ABI234_13905 [Ktedonobacteraceae bacterium]
MILNLGWEGLLPLLPLTKGGKKPEIVQVMIDRLVESNDKELLALAEMYGGLAFTSEPEKIRFKRRFKMFQEIMKDSWVYQEIVQESEERGEERGRKEGELQALRMAIMQFVKQYFPTLEKLALQQIELIADVHVLNVLLVSIFSTKEVDVVRKLLMDATKG